MATVPIVSKTTKSAILKAGEKFILPPNSKVIAITGALDSTCNNLPTPETLDCYSFQWELEGPNTGSDAWENGTIDNIKIGDAIIPVNGDGFLPNNNGEAILIRAMELAGFIDVSTSLSMLTRRGLFSVCFKTTASIAARSYLSMHSSDSSYILIPARLLTDSTATCTCA